MPAPTFVSAVILGISLVSLSFGSVVTQGGQPLSSPGYNAPASAPPQTSLTYSGSYHQAPAPITPAGGTPSTGAYCQPSPKDVATPEPASMLLLGSGLIGVAVATRRKRSA